MDRVISSYTATVRALLRTRQARGRPPARDGARVLAVCMPRTPGERDLPGAQAEVALLSSTFAGRVTLLEGEHATHASVLAALPGHAWAHFACHAHNDLDEPSASRLLVHDHRSDPLTLAELSRLRLDRAELAFLSACSTAQVAPGLADEAIHLMSGFQLTGYRHVIGTLWPVPDRLSLQLADHLYRDLKQAGFDSGCCAAALHAAVIRLSRIWRDTPSLWAAHIHTGE